MSIIIKSNELNLLIYKYLLESGLEHSAFSLFNEASLSDSATQFKFDVKSGHLLTLLEKSLIFTQIQQHMNFSEYMDCEQPFHLLKKHTCSIVQKAKQDKQKFYQELTSTITDSMRRTNTIYHTQVKNKQYEEIVYEPRGTNYLEKCPKIKINKQNNTAQNISLEGTNNSSKIIVSDYDEKSLTILKYDIDNISQFLEIEMIVPGIIKEQCKPILKSAISPITDTCQRQTLIQVYEDNLINIRTLAQEKEDIRTQDQSNIDIKTIKIDGITDQINSISFNPNFPFLVNFGSQTVNKQSNGTQINGQETKMSFSKYQYMQFSTYTMVNTNNLKKVMSGIGLLIWRFFSQYIVYKIDEQSNKQSLSLRTLKKTQENNLVLLQYNLHEVHTLLTIELSITKNYFSVLTKTNKIFIYTFDNPEPLYTIIQSQSTHIHKMIWSYSKDVDYVTYLTNNYIKLWEVQLSEFSKKISTKQYDSKLRDIVSIQKNQQQSFLVAIGEQNLLIYDISAAKAERIQLTEDVDSNFLKALNRNVITLWNQNMIYFLTGQQLKPLFL